MLFSSTSYLFTLAYWTTCELTTACSRNSEQNNFQQTNGAFGNVDESCILKVLHTQAALKFANISASDTQGTNAEQWDMGLKCSLQYEV